MNGVILVHTAEYGKCDTVEPYSIVDIMLALVRQFKSTPLKIWRIFGKSPPFFGVFKFNFFGSYLTFQINSLYFTGENIIYVQISTSIYEGYEFNDHSSKSLARTFSVITSIFYFCWVETGQESPYIMFYYWFSNNHKSCFIHWFIFYFYPLHDHIADWHDYFAMKWSNHCINSMTNV